ncbi:hypothetical protein IC582_025559 [Cucumis melo]
MSTDASQPCSATHQTERSKCQLHIGVVRIKNFHKDGNEKKQYPDKAIMKVHSNESCCQ